MIYVQHHALCAFEKNAAAEFEGGVQTLPCRTGIFQNIICDFEKLALEVSCIRWWQVETFAQRRVVRDEALQFHVERCFVGKVSYANGAAANFILVSRANTALCRTNLRAASLRFAGRVDVFVPWQDEAGIVGQQQVIRAKMDILLFHAGDFIQELPWINNHAIANNRELTTANNTGWQKIQLEDLAIDDECVAGIMACLLYTSDAADD